MNKIKLNDVEVSLEDVARQIKEAGLSDEATKLLEKKTTYRIGDRFVIKHCGSCSDYILCIHDYEKVVLINLSNGYLWDNPVDVENSTEVTEDEMRRIISHKDVYYGLNGCYFKRIKEV